MPVVDLTPFIHVQRLPDSKDMQAVLRRHEAALAARPASWGEPETVSRIEDIDRTSREGWAKEIEYLCERGLFRVEGESVRPTVYGAGTFFWKGIRPFPANYAPLVQLVRIGIPSLLALGLAWLISRLAPGSETLLLWAMGAVGAAYGLGLWYHGYFWCLAVPSCAVFLATQRTDLAARSAVYAAMGLVVGFLVSAVRSQSRGRKLMAHQPTPGPKPGRTLNRWIIAGAVAAGILSGLYNARGLNFVTRRDLAAEASLQRIEQILSSAKSLRVQFTRDTVRRNRKTRLVGTLMLKQGNRMWLSMKPESTEGQEDGNESLMVSNGSGLGLFVRTKDGLRQVTNPDAVKPEDLNAKAGLLLGRQSVPFAMQFLLQSLPELKKTFEVTHLKEDATGGLLTYDVQIWTAALKWDSKTGLPQQRILEDRYTIGQKNAVIETFLEWELDGEIPDDAFEFPKTK
jgi:outer membrane lipoprotein-sorting protein